MISCLHIFVKIACIARYYCNRVSLVSGLPLQITRTNARPKFAKKSNFANVLKSCIFGVRNKIIKV